MSGHPPALTGERTLPGIASENYWFRRHEVVYRECAATCRREGWGTVVDAGCGEGYGADLLADAAEHVVAIDLDLPTVVHVGETYPRLAAVCGNLVQLPLADDAAGAVVSLQVIEHLWDVDAYLGEVARVLRPGGTLVCSTPNRLTFTPDSGTPVNPFHAVELTAGELVDRLSAHLDVRAIWGLWHGPRLARVDATHGTALPQLLAEAGEPGRWPRWLADVVTGVTASDFVIAWPDDLAALDDSLDLVAVCRSSR